MIEIIEIGSDIYIYIFIFIIHNIKRRAFSIAILRAPWRSQLILVFGCNEGIRNRLIICDVILLPYSLFARVGRSGRVYVDSLVDILRDMNINTVAFTQGVERLFIDLPDADAMKIENDNASNEFIAYAFKFAQMS